MDPGGRGRELWSGDTTTASPTPPGPGTTASPTPPGHNVGTADMVGEGAQLKAPSQQVMHCYEHNNADTKQYDGVDLSLAPEVLPCCPDDRGEQGGTVETGPCLALYNKAGVLYLSMGLTGQSVLGQDNDVDLDGGEGEGEQDDLQLKMDTNKNALAAMREEGGWYRELGKLSTLGTWRLGSYGAPLTLRRELSRLPTINEKRAWKISKRKPKGGPSDHLGNVKLSYSDGHRFVY